MLYTTEYEGEAETGDWNVQKLSNKETKRDRRERERETRLLKRGVTLLYGVFLCKDNSSDISNKEE